MKQIIRKATDVMCLFMGLAIFTLMPYEVFGFFGVIWFYFWAIVGLLFFKSKLGKKVIDWSISHD